MFHESPFNWWGPGSPGWHTTYKTTTLERVHTLDDEVRRIVRQELADLMPIDVPDEPPEDP